MCLKELVTGETMSPAGIAATSRITKLYSAEKIITQNSTAMSLLNCHPVEATIVLLAKAR